MDASHSARFAVRPVSPEEAALVLEVTLRCWTGTVAANSSAYRETPEKVAADLRAGHGVFAVLDGEIVGSGRFVPVPGPADESDWIEVKRVGVLATHRKRGLAAPMVAALEAEGKRRGHPGAQLGVRADQPRLVAFWASLGYAVAHDVTLSNPNPLTPTPTFMRKRL